MQTKINGATLTNIGRKRTKNEDAAYFNSCEDFTLLMIADGIGGHKKGEVASDMTISIISNKISNFEKAFKLTTSRRLIKNAIKYANKEVNNLSVKQEYLDMGTTLVLALVLKEKTIIANIGDSRLYRFDKEFGLTQLTVDQNYVQYMIQIGKMTKEEAKNSNKKNVLLNALGVNPSVYYDEQIIDNNYDALLLCSDGLYNMVSLEELNKIMYLNISVEEKVKKLIDTANRNGGFDNIGVSLMEVKQC